MSHYTEQREADEIWKNAPVTATHYGGGKYWRMHDSGNFWETECAFQWVFSNESPMSFIDYQERPKTNTKPHQSEPVPLKPRNPYQRTIIGLDGSKCAVDVYRVLDAFKTDSPALDHAVKKILCPGTRHQKDREQDLKEAIKSIEAELLLMRQR